MVYLFEYGFDGAVWNFTVDAATPEEARARVLEMGHASLMGEVAERIEAPRGAHLSLVEPA